MSKPNKYGPNIAGTNRVLAVGPKYTRALRRTAESKRRRREQLPAFRPYPVNGTQKQQFFWGSELEFRLMRDREGMTLKEFLVMMQPEWKEWRDG